MEVLGYGFFQPAHVRALGSYPRDQGGREVDAREHREVVDHHRDLDRLSHGRKVPEEALLARLPVERRDDEYAVRADPLGVARELDGLPRAARADPDHERHAPPDDRDHFFSETLALFTGEVRELACAPQRGDAVYPCLYKAFHHGLGGPEVYLPPLVEGSDHRGHESPEHLVLHLPLAPGRGPGPR